MGSILRQPGLSRYQTSNRLFTATRDDGVRAVITGTMKRV